MVSSEVRNSRVIEVYDSDVCADANLPNFPLNKYLHTKCKAGPVPPCSHCSTIYLVIISPIDLTGFWQSRVELIFDMARQI
jgi:hypothetical protein